MSTRIMASEAYKAYPAGGARRAGAMPVVRPTIRRLARLVLVLFRWFGEQLRLMSGLKGEVTAGEAARRIKHLMSDGRYAEAVTFGRSVRPALASLGAADQPDQRLDLAEFEVAYALALIYIGMVTKGMGLLQALIAEWEAGEKPEEAARQGDPRSPAGKQRNYVLGRAHNNLGYACGWQGQYGPALWEFLAALPYFRTSELWEELANTYDNMGRVYALVGQRDLAERLVEAGLGLRRKLKRDDRTGLSLNLRAIVHLRFGEPQQALQLSRQALSTFEHLQKPRGVGLARITLSRSLRQLAAFPGAYSREQRVAFLHQAEMHLKQAISIFEDSVDELVRRIETYEELGCTYRDLAALAGCSGSNGLSARIAAHYAEQAGQYLQAAIGLSEGKYPALYNESCRALEQMSAHNGDHRITLPPLSCAARPMTSVATEWVVGPNHGR